MKKLVFMLLVLSTMSCNVMQYYEPKFALGMTEQEFKLANKAATQVYGDQNGTLVYRTFNDFTKTFKFFRFKEQKLIQFEEGIYPDDYKSMRL
jgi:hypothetical protein